MLNSRLQSVQNKLDVHGPSRLENHGSDVGTNSYDSDYFLDGESDTFDPPFLIADTHTDYNDVIDRTECSTSATVAGAAGAIVAMETTIYNGVPDGDSLIGEFSGDYKWSSFNALSNSTAEVWCEMFDENGNTFDKEFVFNRTSFPAEFWYGGDDFTEFCYYPDTPDSDWLTFRIGSKTSTSALGVSQASISLGDPGYGDEHVEMDYWEIQNWN